MWNIESEFKTLVNKMHTYHLFHTLRAKICITNILHSWHFQGEKNRLNKKK